MNVHEYVEYLEEENRQLHTAMIGKRQPFPFEWKLTRAEELILNSLYTAPDHKRSHEALLIASRINPYAGIKMIQVRIHNLRKKLNPYNIAIRTLRFEGYQLSPRSVEIIREALA